jgi:DNA polymerase-3 subunit chi
VTQVFFYHNAANRIGATAALIGKACAQKKPLLVYAPDADIAAALDRQLWAQAPTSFVPHVAADSPLAAETPVLIASSLESPAARRTAFQPLQRRAARLFALCESD